MVLILLSWSLQFRRLPISKFKIGDEKNGDIDMAGRDGIPVTSVTSSVGSVTST
jgi:hypothetical protein